MTEQYINFLVQHSVPKAMSLQEIADATTNDRELQALRAAVRLNKWDADTVKPYQPYRDELTIGFKNVLLRGTRIVIPKALQKRAVELAHESHQGLAKTKALLREKIWFIGIDKLVQQLLDACLACQAVGRPNPPPPLQPSEMPNAPWHTLHIDFCGPLPSNEYLLVLIDRYSRFPEVEIVNSTKASCVIPKLDKIFAVHGLPCKIVSDNGPPFHGAEFKKYIQVLGIEHSFVTPYWPQANGEVERFNQPLKKAIQ
ncbi:MAG: DDE-type integrase/transposase/recombinase, partial [Planctomycetaceae bacterium]|nr:DDE-type integrase/transposase/recombinase [Planctomycetaceae bacterium]